METMSEENLVTIRVKTEPQDVDEFSIGATASSSTWKDSAASTDEEKTKHSREEDHRISQETGTQRNVFYGRSVVKDSRSKHERELISRIKEIVPTHMVINEFYISQCSGKQTEKYEFEHVSSSLGSRASGSVVEAGDIEGVSDHQDQYLSSSYQGEQGIKLEKGGVRETYQDVQSGTSTHAQQEVARIKQEVATQSENLERCYTGNQGYSTENDDISPQDIDTNYAMYLVDDTEMDDTDNGGKGESIKPSDHRNTLDIVNNVTKQQMWNSGSNDFKFRASGNTSERQPDAGTNPVYQWRLPTYPGRPLDEITHEEGSFCCDMCSAKYTQMYHLLRHKKAHKRAGRFTCSICQKKFNKAEVLINHILKHKGLQEFQDKICGKCFTKMDDEEEHICAVRFSCDLCATVFSTAESLQEHLLNHSDDMQENRSKISGACFRAVTELESHLNALEKVPVQCLLCPEILENKQQLNIHMGVHAPQRLSRSLHSRASGAANSKTLGSIKWGTTEKRNWKNCVENVQNTKKYFSCIICMKTFRSISGLTSHKKSHKIEKDMLITRQSIRILSPSVTEVELIKSIEETVGQDPLTDSKNTSGETCPDSLRRSLVNEICEKGISTVKQERPDDLEHPHSECSNLTEGINNSDRISDEKITRDILTSVKKEDDRDLVRQTSPEKGFKHVNQTVSPKKEFKHVNQIELPEKRFKHVNSSASPEKRFKHVNPKSSPEKGYKCDLCSFQFRCLNNLQQHQRFHRHSVNKSTFQTFRMCPKQRLQMEVDHKSLKT